MNFHYLNFQFWSGYSHFRLFRFWVHFFLHWKTVHDPSGLSGSSQEMVVPSALGNDSILNQLHYIEVHVLVNFSLWECCDIDLTDVFNQRILQQLMNFFSKIVFSRQFISCRHLNMKKVDGKIREKEVGPRFEMKRKFLFLFLISIVNNNSL